MSYRISRYADNLLWVVVEGRLSLEQAERYFQELWAILDACPCPTDLLIDGRHADNTSPAARRRTEQVMHHPHFGNLAFVVSEHHLLLFGPLAQLFGGISIFGQEHEALAYLQGARGSQPPMAERAFPLPPPPAEREFSPARHRPLAGSRPLPPPPASRIPLSAQRAAALAAAAPPEPAFTEPAPVEPAAVSAPPPAEPPRASAGLFGSLAGWARRRAR